MLILVIDDWCVSCEIAIRWIKLDLTDDKSTLVQVMAWCRQAASHYLNQCWPRSLPSYGVTRPQWVKPLSDTIWLQWAGSPLIHLLGCWPHISFTTVYLTHCSWLMPKNFWILILNDDFGSILCSTGMYSSNLLLVQVMVWVSSGNKSLSEPLLTNIFVPIWCHWGVMS